MLSAFRKNSVSIAISAAAFSGFGAWLYVPDTASIQTVYERYIATEESRPRVFEEGIAVKLNREAPPVAALEEALRDQPWAAIEVSPGFNVQPTQLRALPLASQRMAMNLLSSNESFRRRIEAPVLSPIQRPVENLRATAPANRRGVSDRQDIFIAERSRRLEVLNPQWVEAVPRETNEAVPRSVSSKTISLSKLGLTREQVFASLFVPMANPSKKPKTVAKAVEPTNNEADSVAARALGLRAPAGRQIMIRGPIELSGGLALTHAKDRIAVLRESRGQFIESGAVWIREARYEIFVESMEGQLVAEVRSPQGEVVGRGQLALGSIATSPTSNSLDGVTLRVLPVSTGISGRVQSAYSTGSISKGLHGARVEFLGTPSTVKTVSGGLFEEKKFSEGSRVMVSLQARDHWPTLSFLTTGSEPVISVFSKKMMEAFVSLTAKDTTAVDFAMKTKGVIWGRVTRSGQMVANAEIDVITEDSGDPVYFNDLMIPESNLKKTGSNGLFAVPSVGAGLQAVQVRIGTRVSDPVFVRTDIRSVAALELDVMKASDIEARAFDAFRPDMPLRVEVSPFGHVKSRKMVVEGDSGSRVKLAHLGQPSILNVNGGSEYLSTRIIQNPETRNLFMPMVPRAWFDRIIGSLRYNSQPATGNVIGFISGARFRVSMDDDALASNAKVVYFDPSGEISNNAYGEPGGGFILLGVKNGLQTVLIEADGSDRVFAAAVLVQDGVVASLSHWLR